MLLSRVVASIRFFLCLATLSLSLTLPLMAQEAAISTTSIYRNESIGVRGAFAEQWNIITTRDQAPEALKPNFPENKGPNDPPLFIGMHESEQLFMRLMSETFFDDLEAYAELLAQGINSQGLEITSAKLSSDNSSLVLDYRHPTLGLRFQERVSMLPDSQFVRMAIWANEASWSVFASDIEAAFNTVELNNAINADSGWQTVWSDIDQRLQPDNLAGVSLAQPAPQPVSSVSCPDPTSSMLWRVESPSLDERGSEIYLFGSIHVGKAEFYPLAPEIEQVFRESDYLVFEVDPRTVADPAVIMDMQARGLLPQGETLADVVSPAVIADFRRLMSNMGLPAENFMGMQPWFVTLMLSGLQMNALGYLPQYGLESYFLSEKATDTEILELESIEEQIGFLESLNAETFLAYTIESFAAGNEEIESLIDAWECADKAPLTDMLFADFEDEELNAVERTDMERLMDSLYTRRNEDMAGTISAYTESAQGDYFVVVGSAHLLGEGSVVELLRQGGFQVSPVLLQP